MADNTRETRQITRVESHCVNYRVTLQVLQFTSRVTWHGFLQFAFDTIYACRHNLRHMQLLGACAHNFLLFRTAITHVVALVQS